MRFEIEGKASIDEPSEAVIRRSIKSLKSYGPHSYASLTDADGSYLQVAGGGTTCMLELFNAQTSKRQRAFHDNPSTARPDGTLLVFRAGEMPMRADEWFMSDQVLELFLAFLHDAPYPAYVHWRDAPGF